MVKNYYRVLGVAPDATPEQIRSAYREKAKGLHPDRAGGGCEPFQAVQEAYAVLGEPSRRKAHDEQLAREVRSPHAYAGVKPEPLRRRRWPAEPLVPRQQPAGPEASLTGSPLHSLIKESLRIPLGELQPETQSRAGSRRRIHLDIYLTPDEALAGGRLRASIPMRARCRRCDGWGWGAFSTCPLCLGQGILDTEHPVEITYPAGIPDGSIWTVAIRQAGLDEMHLVLRFRVGDA